MIARIDVRIQKNYKNFVFSIKRVIFAIRTKNGHLYEND